MSATRYRAIRRDGRPGRHEVWHAEHKGWSLDRLEEPHTPWLATWLATGETAGLWPSLPKAKRAIDDGSMVAALDRRRAEVVAAWMRCVVVGSLPTAEGAEPLGKSPSANRAR